MYTIQLVNLHWVYPSLTAFPVKLDFPTCEGDILLTVHWGSAKGRLGASVGRKMVGSCPLERHTLQIAAMFDCTLDRLSQQRKSP